VPPAPAKKPATPRLHFIYGTSLGPIAKARSAALDTLCPAEWRGQNVTEYEPAGTRALTLNDIGNALMEELSTPTLLADQRRVVVVKGLKDFFGETTPRGKGAKKPAANAPVAMSERFRQFLEGPFKEVEHALILVAEENEDKGMKVDAETPLVAWLLRNAATQVFRDPPTRFAFEQALYDRDSVKAIALFREWLSPDTRSAVWGAMVGAVRLMLQVKVREQSAAARQEPESFFPRGRGSISSAHSFVVGKAEAGARRYTLGELARAHAALLSVHDAFFPPRRPDVYVPDLESTVEAFILRLCAR